MDAITGRGRAEGLRLVFYGTGAKVRSKHHLYKGI